MRIAVIRFPGSNCDQDGLAALRHDVGVEADYAWHQNSDLSGFDGAFIPGGFSFGDYLRAGAIAARSPIMLAVKELASQGKPVLGVCNGFQVLCEMGLLPGALVRNEKERFVCRWVNLKPVQQNAAWTSRLPAQLTLPIAHGEGRYLCSDDVLKELEDKGRVSLRYEDSEGNPNGSRSNIAGILNDYGNVMGMMPHPERASRPDLCRQDGLEILRGFLAFSA